MKQLTYLLLLALLTLSLPSCTDSDDIDISYDKPIGITAAHIFDNYEPFEEGDFDMTVDGWKLNLQTLVYDNEGKLVDKAEKLCSNLSETLEFTPNLVAGEYTVVTIADFREGLGGKDYKYWNIANEHSLQDLSITESDRYYPTAFETLGLDIKKIEVSESREPISVDIKPITNLVQIFTSDKDYSNWGIEGYSRFSMLIEGYFIRAIKCKNNIRFEDGKISCKYSEQISDYNVAISHTYEKWSEKQAPTGISYRALLPDENKGFTYHIQRRNLPQDYYDSAIILCGEFENEGKSNVLPAMESNKQYVLNMILDAMQLEFIEMPADYRHDVFTQQFVNDYNNKLIEEMVNTKYENILGKDERFANLFFNSNPFEREEKYVQGELIYVSYYPRFTASHYAQYADCIFHNADYSNCVQIDLTLPDTSDSQFEYIKQLLSNRLQAEEVGKYGPEYFTYIEKDKSEDDSRFRVVLGRHYNDNVKKTVFTLMFVLRDKFI